MTSLFEQNFELINTNKFTSKRRKKVYFESSFCSDEISPTNIPTFLQNDQQIPKTMSDLLSESGNYDQNCEALCYGEVSDTLPPSCEIINGDIVSDSICPEYDYSQFNDLTDFIYESEVGTKYRGSTVYTKVKRWTQKEDDLLRKLVNKFTGNWVKISDEIDKNRGKNDEVKTPTDCSKRWISLNNQKPREWTEQEEEKLIDLVATKGKNWKLFEKHFDGFNKNAIRSQYQKLQRDGKIPADKDRKTINCNEYKNKIKYHQASSIIEEKSMEEEDNSKNTKLKSVIKISFESGKDIHLSSKKCSKCDRSLSLKSLYDYEMIELTQKFIFARNSIHKECKCNKNQCDTIVDTPISAFHNFEESSFNIKWE